MANSATAPSTRVRTLNDLLRRHRIGGQVVLTPGVLALGLDLLLLSLMTQSPASMPSCRTTPPISPLTKS